MMTPAYVTTVGADHMIKLPPDMPVGTTVAVIAVPTSTSEGDTEARRARFVATLAAIREASKAGAPHADISDEELTALVEKARRAKA
ncbi:MAG: hypothetical protein JW850_24210 [Thermoflexales bacterium]|nr:hypothetical protein [Thermoflexales bacterium]